MEQLAKLFGSGLRVKVMRLFLLSPGTFFDPKGIAGLIKAKPGIIRREFLKLKDIGLLKKKSDNFQLQEKSELVAPLRQLVAGGDILLKHPLLKKLTGIGGLKLLIASGIFVRDEQSPIDLVIVASDSLHRRAPELIIEGLEARLGRPLNYVLMNADEFEYRRAARDRFVTEALSRPHRKIVDRLGL